jgi:hypothetical protein
MENYYNDFASHLMGMFDSPNKRNLESKNDDLERQKKLRQERLRQEKLRQEQKFLEEMSQANQNSVLESLRVIKINIEEGQPDTFSCKACGKEYKTMHWLDKHIKSKH